MLHIASSLLFISEDLGEKKTVVYLFVKLLRTTHVAGKRLSIANNPIAFYCIFFS